MKDQELPFQYRYFSSYPIENASDALWFSKRINFDIVDLLWRAGPRGLTHTQVSDHLNDSETTGRSQIYAALKDLYVDGKVDRLWDKDENSHRNYLVKLWHPAVLEEEFEDWADDYLMDIELSNLFPHFRSYIAKVMEKISSKRSEIAPLKGRGGWCRNCDISHQAENFFLALLFKAAQDFVFFRDFEPDNDQQRTWLENIEHLYIKNGFLDPNSVQSR